LSKIQKLQNNLKRTFEKLLNQYGQEIHINGQPITAIYVNETKNLPIEQFGIIPTSQTTIYLPISTKITETDQIEVEGKPFRINQIKTYYGIMKIITLQEVEIG